MQDWSMAFWWDPYTSQSYMKEVWVSSSVLESVFRKTQRDCQQFEGSFNVLIEESLVCGFSVILFLSLCGTRTQDSNDWGCNHVASPCPGRKPRVSKTQALGPGELSCTGELVVFRLSLSLSERLLVRPPCHLLNPRSPLNHSGSISTVSNENKANRYHCEPVPWAKNCPRHFACIKSLDPSHKLQDVASRISHFTQRREPCAQKSWVSWSKTTSW